MAFIGNEARDLPACNAAPQPTASPRAPTWLIQDIYKSAETTLRWIIRRLNLLVSQFDTDQILVHVKASISCRPYQTILPLLIIIFRLTTRVLTQGAVLLKKFSQDLILSAAGTMCVSTSMLRCWRSIRWWYWKFEQEFHLRFWCFADRASQYNLSN